MNTEKIKRKKVNTKATLQFLEDLSDGPLSLGQLMESIRIGEELNQVQFAKLLKISRSHLCDIEKGRKFLTPERAAKFAKSLGYSEELFVRLAIQELVDRTGLAYKVILKAA